MEILREEVQMKHDKMVQSEVTELLDATKQDIDDVMATSFNLDMTLTEAALAVDRAQGSAFVLIEIRNLFFYSPIVLNLTLITRMPC